MESRPRCRGSPVRAPPVGFDLGARERGAKDLFVKRTERVRPKNVGGPPKEWAGSAASFSATQAPPNLVRRPLISLCAASGPKEYREKSVRRELKTDAYARTARAIVWV